MPGLIPLSLLPPALVMLLLVASPAYCQTLYQTQDAAQSACPKDVVVWLNTRSGVYHFQGERWYANTEEGAYVCEADANANGDQATRNGQ
jgi:hypothetical protein